MIEHFLQFEFLRHTFYIGLLIGLIASLLATFLVCRRLSFLADALSHVTLAGIAFGLFMEKRFLLIFLSPMYSGMAFSVIGAIFIEKLRSVYQSYQELGIPIVLSGGVGLSVIFIALAKGFNQDLFTYLFGSVSAVSKTDFYMILILSILVLCVVFLFYKELVTLSFDEEHATVSGLQTKHIHFLFIILVAFVIAASMRIVGILLVSALVTLPVAAAMRLAKSYRQLIGYSILFGEFSVILGLILGYYLSIPPGGTLVMIALLILLSTILYKRKRGAYYVYSKSYTF